MRTFDSADATRPPSRRTTLARDGRAVRRRSVVLCAPAFAQIRSRLAVIAFDRGIDRSRGLIAFHAAPYLDAHPGLRRVERHDPRDDRLPVAVSVAPATP